MGEFFGFDSPYVLMGTILGVQQHVQILRGYESK